jgi:glyoxylase-like metal-dependent hydrolase (beta-lactamase superfamily II)
MLQANVAEGIHRVEDAYTNWYLVEDGGRMTVVDSGLPTSWPSLLAALRSLARRPEDVAAIVLTHGHFDHLGFSERARVELGVPVWVHANDVPLTRHPRQYGHERSPAYYFATQFRALPIVAALVRNRAWWPKPVGEVRRLEGEVLDVPGAPKVIATPGHTHGHCALHFPDRDTVIAGDAIVTLNPYTGRRGPQIVAGAATVDSERALASLDELERTGARTLLVGHGEPWTRGAEAAVVAARAAGPS